MFNFVFRDNVAELEENGVLYRAIFGNLQHNAGFLVTAVDIAAESGRDRFFTHWHTVWGCESGAYAQTETAGNFYKD